MTWKSTGRVANASLVFDVAPTDEVIIFRGQNSVFGWNGHGDDLLWQAPLEADRDLGIKLVAVAQGVAVSFADRGSKTSPVFSGRRVSDGELLWQRALDVWPQRRSLVAAGELVHTRAKVARKEYAVVSLDPRTGEEVARSGCAKGQDLLAAGERLFLGGNKQLQAGPFAGPFDTIQSGRITSMATRGADLYFAHGAMFEDGERHVARWRGADMGLRSMSVDATTLSLRLAPHPTREHIVAACPGEGLGVWLLDIEAQRVVWTAEAHPGERPTFPTWTPGGLVVVLTGAPGTPPRVVCLDEETCAAETTPPCQKWPNQAWWLNEHLIVTGGDALEAYAWRP